MHLAADPYGIRELIVLQYVALAPDEVDRSIVIARSICICAKKADSADDYHRVAQSFVEPWVIIGYHFENLMRAIRKRDANAAAAAKAEQDRRAREKSRLHAQGVRHMAQQL